MKPVAQALHQFILETAPELKGSLKWGAPSYGATGNVCYIMAHKKHLNFGFYEGGLLPDPEKLLEGTGAKMRHIKVRAGDDIRQEAFRALIREGVKLQTKEVVQK